MRQFCRDNSAKIYDVGCGVCHQVIPESGEILPGDLILGADSHTCTYGALGAFATGVGSTDLAITLANGKNWFKVPTTIKIIIKGRMPAGIFAKDIILYIIKEIKADGATYKAIEFCGPVIEALGMDERFTISNMAVEMGAKVGIIPADNKVLNWLKPRIPVNKKITLLRPDKDAHYERIIEMDISKLTPLVALPHSVDNAVPAIQLKKQRISQAFIGTCTNGRLTDLKIAAKILKSRKVADEVRLIIAPASRTIYLEALKLGIIDIFIKAGGLVVGPGCGPCVGTHNGIPADGEIVISTANRNFKGRMGNPKAFIYLSSPATAAASSISGYITDPRKYL